MLEIVIGENEKILRAKAKKVTTFDEDLKKLVRDMEATMTAPDPYTETKGVGLAAPQVGVGKRIMLVAFNVGTRKDWKIVAMVNPEILQRSKNECVMDEGCLSLPGMYGKVTRPAKIKVRWQNLLGNWCEKKLDKWDARIFLHEFDHLEGKLFIDYLTKSALEETREGVIKFNEKQAAKKSERFHN